MNEKIDWSNFIILCILSISTIFIVIIISDLSKKVDKLDYQKADKPNVGIPLYNNIESHVSFDPVYFESKIKYFGLASNKEGFYGTTEKRFNTKKECYDYLDRVLLLGKPVDGKKQCLKTY